MPTSVAHRVAVGRDAAVDATARVGTIDSVLIETGATRFSDADGASAESIVDGTISARVASRSASAGRDSSRCSPPWYPAVVDADERTRRALARACWPGKMTTHQAQDDAALVRVGTPGQRVAMVWQITVDAWASAGRPLPAYSRANMPGRLIRDGNG